MDNREIRLTPAQFNFLQRIGSNNFNASTPTVTVASVIRLGLAEKMDTPNYYQITQAGVELLTKIEWERPERALYNGSDPPPAPLRRQTAS